VLVNGANVSSRYIGLPDAAAPGAVYNIDVYYSDRPVPPILTGIRTNNWYFIKGAGYDEKSGIFNIDLDSDPFENLNITFTVARNAKKINKVTLNWKDISKYPNIKINIK
jgi:hypothetical protein